MTFTARIKIVSPTGSSMNYAGPVTVEQKDCIVSALHGETDIATLEQEARQMRARMERLECENDALRESNRLLTQQRDELLAAAELLLSRKRPREKEDDPRLILEIDCMNLEEAIAKAKGGTSC